MTWRSDDIPTTTYYYDSYKEKYYDESNYNTTLKKDNANLKLQLKSYEAEKKAIVAVNNEKEFLHNKKTAEFKLIIHDLMDKKQYSELLLQPKMNDDKQLYLSLLVKEMEQKKHEKIFFVDKDDESRFNNALLEIYEALPVELTDEYKGRAIVAIAMLDNYIENAKSIGKSKEEIKKLFTRKVNMHLKSRENFDLKLSLNDDENVPASAQEFVALLYLKYMDEVAEKEPLKQELGRQLTVKHGVTVSDATNIYTRLRREQVENQRLQLQLDQTKKNEVAEKNLLQEATRTIAEQKRSMEQAASTIEKLQETLKKERAEKENFLSDNKQLRGDLNQDIQSVRGLLNDISSDIFKHSWGVSIFKGARVSTNKQTKNISPIAKKILDCIEGFNLKQGICKQDAINCLARITYLSEKGIESPGNRLTFTSSSGSPDKKEYEKYRDKIREFQAHLVVSDNTPCYS